MRSRPRGDCTRGGGAVHVHTYIQPACAFSSKRKGPACRPLLAVPVLKLFAVLVFSLHTAHLTHTQVARLRREAAADRRRLEARLHAVLHAHAHTHTQPPPPPLPRLPLAAGPAATQQQVASTSSSRHRSSAPAPTTAASDHAAAANTAAATARVRSGPPPGFEFFVATRTAAAVADLCRPDSAHALLIPVRKNSFPRPLPMKPPTCFFELN